MKEVFIERDGFLRAALRENGVLKELKVIKDTGKPTEGDIFYGTIKNVSHGQNAVFIDIGTKKNAYLYVTDRTKLPAYHVGAGIIVEILRSESGKKGAKVTDKISLTDGIVVVMSGKGHSFSKNVDVERFTERHQNVVDRPGLHILYRSGSLELEPAELSGKTAEIVEEFRSILSQGGRMLEPGRIFKDRHLLDSLTAKAMADPSEILMIHSNDPNVTADLKLKFPEAVVHDYPPATHVFAAHGLENPIDRLRNRVVALSGGGTLIIEETEALTSIDVNSGSMKAKGGIGQGVYELNEEALRTALDEIRLRNLAGIIIIDFVTMKRETDRIRLFETAVELTKGIVPLTKVYPITELGLMQIARRRQGESLSRTLFSSDHQKKLPVSASYLYKMIRLKLDDPGVSLKSFQITANPAYTYDLKAIEMILGQDYPDFTFRIETSFETDTVKVSPVLF